MAYGNILGYEPAAQPGAYKFQQANGQSVLLAGAPAENLKAKLDASASLAGQKTAGPGGAPLADMMPEPEPAMSVAPPPEPAPAMSMAPPPPSPPPGPNASAMPPPGPAPMSQVQPGPRVELVPTAENPTPNGVPAPAAPAAPAAPSARPYMVNGVNTGIIQMPDGTLQQRQAYTPAVTAEQLAAKAGTGVMLAHSGSESTTGGFEKSQEYLDERHRLAEEKGQIIDKTAEVEAANATREQELAAVQFKNAAALQAEELARSNAIADRVAKDEQTKNQLVKEYGNAKVNPTRLFSGASGAARGIAMVIASGLGAAGSGFMAAAGKPGMPNMGFQAMNMAIDRDIAAQENEIKIKGEMANNALAQFKQSGMDLTQARVALKSAQLGWAQAQTQQLAATKAGSTVGINAASMHNALGNAINEQDEEYRRQALGTATKAVAGQVQYPHGASGGGMVAVSPDKAIALGEKREEGKAKMASTAKTLAEVESESAKLAGGALANPQVAADYNKGIQFVDSAQAAHGEAVAKMGGKMNPRTGEIEWDPKVDTAGAGAGARLFSPVYTSDEAAGINAAVGGGAAAVEKGIEGDAAGEAGIKQYKELMTSGNAASRRAAAETYAKDLASRRRAVDASAPAPVRAARERNK